MFAIAFNTHLKRYSYFIRISYLLNLYKIYYEFKNPLEY